jgi:hypothetical protein
MAECNKCLTNSRLLKLCIVEDPNLFMDLLSEYKQISSVGGVRKFGWNPQTRDEGK